MWFTVGRVVICLLLVLVVYSGIVPNKASFIAFGFSLNNVLLFTTFSLFSRLNFRSIQFADVFYQFVNNISKHLDFYLEIESRFTDVNGVSLAKTCTRVLFLNLYS